MKKNVKVKTLRLKPEVINKVEEMAEKENRNFSNMVETILLKYDPTEVSRIL